jgi:hypothetical protein
MITLAPNENITTLAPHDSILSQMITFLPQMIILAPDDNISSQMITFCAR